MPVEIKPLKGYINPINNEENTLSLFVKSDFELDEHLQKSKQKLVTSLTSIINLFKNTQDIHFYHKLGVPHCYKGGTDYLRTSSFRLSLDSLDKNLDDSLKETNSLCLNKFYSHFVNIVVKNNNKVLILNNDNFQKANHIIRSAISNNNKYSFDGNPFEKIMSKIKKNRCINKQTKTINEMYLSILKQHMEYLT